jgi:hypothetical protein
MDVLLDCLLYRRTASAFRAPVSIGSREQTNVGSTLQGLRVHGRSITLGAGNPTLIATVVLQNRSHHWDHRVPVDVNMNTDLYFLRRLRDESASMTRPSDLRRIQLLANQIWREAGCPQGRHQEHWSEAERRLQSAGLL